MSKVGLRIYTTFVRPDKELIEGFRGIPASNISDCMGRLFCLHSAIKPMGKARQILGTALTVKGALADNLLFNKAISLAQPGDVIVVNDCGNLNHSVCGDLMYQYAITKGVAGFVVDGCVRDTAFLANSEFPVYARGATPRGPYKNGFGEINVDIACGDQVVHPGDIIVGDEDGIVVIRPDDAAYLITEAKKVVEMELGFDQAIQDGKWEESPGFQMINKLVEQKGFEII